jgi:hypothetical protein
MMSDLTGLVGPNDCGHEFFVLMQKRSDGKTYSDMHKVSGQKFFLDRKEAEDYQKTDEILMHFYRVVRMVGFLAINEEADVETPHAGAYVRKAHTDEGRQPACAIGV